MLSGNGAGRIPSVLEKQGVWESDAFFCTCEAGGWVDCTVDWASGWILINILRCAAEIETLFPIYTILNRGSLPHFSSIRTGPHPRLPRPIRNNTFPYPPHPRAVCQKTTLRTSHLGLYARYSFYRSPHTALLGCTWSSAMIVPPRCGLCLPELEDELICE